MNHSRAVIKWMNEPPEGVEAKVREDVTVSLWDLDKPSDLWFHTVILTNDLDGPCVTMSGSQDGSFTSTYHEVTEWVNT